jgi:hypothetical protein
MRWALDFVSSNANPRRGVAERVTSFYSFQAAEALGALSSLSSVPLLKHYVQPENEPSRSVRETCEIAVAKIEYDHSEQGRKEVAEKGKKE